MAFSYTSDSYAVGSRRRACGTWLQAAADTGGDIVTGLQSITDYGFVQTDDTATRSPNTKISESSGTLTITNDYASAVMSGNWYAYGR